jgi:ABC-type branched-subunit amino acid transport system substrate-binding protein
MMRTVPRLAAAMALLVALLAACGNDDGTGDGDASSTPAEKIDYEAIGLWDDGPCDEAKPPLKLGLMVVFESPVISLKDQALALEAAAEAFNARGGANGACIQVTTCDDGANLDQSLACVRKLDEAGVVATINDQGTAAQAEVSAAMKDAKIPRVASNVTPSDWADPNMYPTDASGTGVTFLLPQALVNEDIKKIGLVRVDLAAASAITGLLDTIYGDDGVEFVADVPVPAGTTDFTQFILAVEKGGAEGFSIVLGEREAVQVAKAAQQMGTKLTISTSLGTFSHAAVADLGELAEQMIFVFSFPPATVDLPVYAAMRADLAASGEKDLQPEKLRSSPIRSWIGLYALLWMIRDAGLTEFTRENITTLLQSAKEVPMLGMFGDESWTPNTDHPGLLKRAGTNHWGFYRWDPDATAPGGLKGNFVEAGSTNFDEVLCGSAFGAPPPC